jgi:hypothetical protein
MPRFDTHIFGRFVTTSTSTLTCWSRARPTPSPWASPSSSGARSTRILMKSLPGEVQVTVARDVLFVLKITVCSAALEVFPFRAATVTYPLSPKVIKR